jgi:hypothetical protein
VKVVCYEPWYAKAHQRALRAFAAGIPGAEVRDVRDYVKCDIAVVFGGHSKRFFNVTKDKHAIIKMHLPSRTLLVIEAGFLFRPDYVQIGWGGIGGTADHKTKGVPGDRWEDLVRRGIAPRKWVSRTAGPIVVCGQVPHDVQVQNSNHIEWCQATVRHYQKAGRKVVFRPHPKVEVAEKYGVDPVLIDRRPLKDVLAEASLFVTFNSTVGVEAVISGVPTVAVNKGSMAWAVSSHGLDDEPYRRGRRSWLWALAYSQWNHEEMARGLPWRHLTRTT